MHQHLSPFNFSTLSIEQMRDTFSMDWRKFHASAIHKFNLMYFVIPGENDHMIFNHETVLMHTGRDYDSALKAFILTLNGFYGSFLLNMENPYEIKKREGGIYRLRDDLLGKGWISKDGTFVPPPLEHYLKHEPRFKLNVLDVMTVKHFTFDCEIPVLN